MWKRFVKSRRERANGGHAFWCNSQHSLREPVDGIRSPHECGSPRVAARSCDDNFKRLARVQQRGESVTRRVNSELWRDSRERFERTFRVLAVPRVVCISEKTVEQNCRG